MKQVIAIVFSGIFLFACNEEEKPNTDKQYTKEELTDLSVEMNNWDAQRQQDEIDQYIKRHGWTMEQTKSGVYYMTIKEGRGDAAKTGQTARVTYDIFLLDGTKCYSSDSTGAKDFEIGEDYVESGLHEGILLMQPGDQMRFILPSHLAHGLTGDQEKIPPRSSVVYEVTLLELH
jgi:FKBP-type peptidyl-prolyl cis-trans isomerase FkpA